MMESCPYSTDCTGCISYRDTLLEVSHVGVSYGPTVVLRDVNVEIKDVSRKCHVQGQVVGFLGPSGSGKTTLFRVIAGLDKPTTGQVFINSNREPVKAGMVGVVAQSYTLFEHRTVLGNLLLGARRAEKDAKLAHDKAMAYLAKFNLADKTHLYPAQLSGGQRQRIAIVQQLLCSEHFLLMDEPFSGLDMLNVERVSKLIDEVACMNDLNTIVVVTHDITAAAAISDHLWLLGHERDEKGDIIPGTRIVENYDLVDRGLCWHPDILTRPAFVDFVREVKERFRTL